MIYDDASQLTADERTDEVAALLAAGFLRLKRYTRCLPAGSLSRRRPESPLPRGPAW